MSPPSLQLERKSRDASWGLRVVVLLAVVAMSLALVALHRAGSGAGGAAAAESEPALTESALATYLAVALEVRLGRREAREAGWEPLTWAEYPRVAAALERAGWTMADYMRVEGQVKAAQVEIDAPGTSFDPDDPHSAPLPAKQVELVRARLADVRVAQGPLPES